MENHVNTAARIVAAFFVLAAHCTACAQSASPTETHSVYSDLSEKACKTLDVDTESGYSKQHCNGVLGYGLLVEEQDGRTSVTVVTPDNREFVVNVGDRVEGGFTTLGPRAEWRTSVVNGHKSVIALVYRVNEQDASNVDVNHPRTTSRLVVVRVNATSVCAIAVIEPGATQNDLARAAAEGMTQAGCIK